jgi:flagellar hook-basal body complex protein FliE
MTINNTFRSKVMKAAWTSFRQNRMKGFAAALKSAWAWAKRTLLKAEKAAQDVVCIAGAVCRETEKAVAINVKFECATTNKVLSRQAWIPKSMINRNGEIPEWFYAKKVNEIKLDLGNRSFIVSL